MALWAARIIRAGLLALAALPTPPSAAGAQTPPYPAKPIRLVVPYPAGGPADFFGRSLANVLSQRLGQAIVIDNRGGATGTVGTDNVVRSPPDGYALLLNGPTSLAVAPLVAESVPFDAFKDLAPVSLVVLAPEALAASPKLGVRSLTAFIAYARAHPGRLNMASAGSAGMPHLAGELLQREAGFTAIHVPYRGAAPAVADMLSGQVDFMFADLPVLIPHLQSGGLVGLALGSARRAAVLPELPTTVEQGYPDVIVENWYGLFAPAATPRAIVATLNQAVVAALDEPALREALARQGAQAQASTPDELATRLRADAAKWGRLAKTIGARLD